MSLLDLLETLMMDEEAYFLPHHPDFNYHKISPTTNQNKFISYQLPVKLNNLTWHQSRLNLSILAKIEGYVKLPENDYQLDTADCCIFRNYTIIKDGQLNVTVLPVLLSDMTYHKLQSLISIVVKDGVYLIDLTTLPMINAQDNMTDGKVLAEMALRQLQLKCHIKVLKSKMMEIKNTLSDKDVYLATQGIKNGCYSPVQSPQKKGYETVKAFVIKIQGSLMPKVEDIKKTKLNICGHYMKEMMDIKDEDVHQTYNNCHRELKLLTSQILKIKFGLILSNQWVDQDSVDIHVFGKTTKVTFVLEDLKVYY